MSLFEFLSGAGASLFSFLGGSAFRMVWGEVSAHFTAKREHQQEQERMRLQDELAAKQHGRNLEAVKIQAENQVQIVRVQGEVQESALSAEAFLEAVRSTGRQVGIAWVDAWNATIRPGVATWAIVMLTAHEWFGMALSDATAQVAFAALGIYLADRTLGKRGK